MKRSVSKPFVITIFLLSLSSIIRLAVDVENVELVKNKQQFHVFYQISSAFSDVNESEIRDAESKVQNAFKAVVEAYEAGGNVKTLLDKLNKALDLLSESNRSNPEKKEILVTRAYGIAETVEKEAHQVKEEGVRLRQTEMIMWILTLSGLAVGAFLIYLFGPKVYWPIWLKMKRNYTIRIAEEKRQVKKGSWITDGEVLAVVISIIVLVSVFAYRDFYYSGKVIEPFSEFAILGSKGMIDDYPRNVTVGETVHLNIYIGNHLGKPTYYIVMAKLIERNDPLSPLPGGARVIFSYILAPEETRITPINITIEKPGLDQRLVFELWVFNEKSNRTEYHDRNGWIWINVLET